MKDLRTFLTGSHQYGEPGSSSDIDLVVYASAGVIAKLARLAGEQLQTGLSGDGVVSASLQFGKLNLILMDGPGLFEVWQKGTDELVLKVLDEGRPIQREEAVEYLTRKREEYFEAEEKAEFERLNLKPCVPAEFPRYEQ